MSNIAMLEGWTITSVETIENYSRTDDTCLSILDEIKNAKLSNTEDSADVKGKNDQTLFTIKKGKAVSGSGASGYISGNLMALQTGAEPVEGKIKFRKREVIKFAILKRKLFWYVYPDLVYKWICYSKKWGGWIEYDQYKKYKNEEKRNK